jgi:hypothetical protein
MAMAGQARGAGRESVVSTAHTSPSYDVDLVAPASVAPCPVEPSDGCCGPLAPGQWDPAHPVLDHYVGCLTADRDAPWVEAFDRLLGAYHGAPASEAAGPLTGVVRRLRQPAAGMPATTVRFLEQIRDACAAHPSGTLEVARSPAMAAPPGPEHP